MVFLPSFTSKIKPGKPWKFPGPLLTGTCGVYQAVVTIASVLLSLTVSPSFIDISTLSTSLE